MAIRAIGAREPSPKLPRAPKGASQNVSGLEHAGDCVGARFCLGVLHVK